jgi:sialate O-acetylesterase
MLAGLYAGLFVLLGVTSAAADVKLPALIADNMVLQQGRQVAIWGTADAGEQVTVTLGEQKQTATADSSGQWKVLLGPLTAGGPWEMTVAGKNTITIHNVLAGEVWVCAGQSNMEMAVKNDPPRAWGGVMNADQEAAAGNFPMIHLFTVAHALSSQPQSDVKGQWVVASPQTVGDFSAAGYFFGRDLHRALKVPVGVIASSWGGTPVEGWTSGAALQADPEFKPLVDSWSQKIAEFPHLLETYQRDLAEAEKSSEEAEAKGKPAVTLPAVPRDPRSDPWRTAGLWNGMIAPLTSYAIAGTIWYQGEANARYAYQYRKLFATMIQDWRRAWGEPDAAFLFVQLASYGLVTPPSDWAVLRESQAKTLALPNTGMAVAADIGDSQNIHPKNKQEVGRRLALAAEAVTYGRKVEYSGPVFESLHTEKGTLRLQFGHLGGGLAMHGAKLTGFLVAGDDQKFVAADAKIEGKTVVVSSRQVPNPVAARYAWADDPQCSLYNKAGLPAPPFRSDDWTVPTQGLTAK